MCSYIPWETDNLLILLFNTSERYLSLRMSCFCEKQQRDGDLRKNGTILPHQEHQNKTLKCTCFVDQALSLLFHPFLIVVFHILFVFPTTAVCLSHRWRVMGEVCVAVVTIKLRHGALTISFNHGVCRKNSWSMDMKNSLGITKQER